MNNPTQAWWSRTVGRAAAVVALAASLAVAPSIARAACVGDCNNNNEVGIEELVIGVNINLGTAEFNTCTAADSDGNNMVLVNDNVTAVNNALHGCPVAGVCGDGITQSGEECDPGSICIGGDNANTVCTKESDCQGEGVCDTFGQKGPAGTVPRKVCSADDQCGGAKCIHCKSFGGNGCANNCTTETAERLKLVPGEIESGDIKPGTSGAFVHGDPFMIPLRLNGINTLISGKPGANNLVPIVQKPSGVGLPRIPITTLACACVRGTVFRTCGGTEYEADGGPSTDCTNDPTVCEGKKPCAPVAGPGNSGEGVLGCTGLPSASYEIVQDAGGDQCAIDLPPMTCTAAGDAMYVPGAAGPAGSQVLAAASAIGTTQGICTGSGGDYGADGQFCTDDDPTTPDSVRGVPAIVTLVTGTATATMKNADGVNGDDLGPYEISGNPISCELIAAGNTAGAAQAGAFTALDNPTLGDVANVNVFVSQCTLAADPTVTACCSDPTDTDCCGNGRLEAGETCDDGNLAACGPCNAECSAAGTGTCPAVTACNANAVCTSGRCVSGVCE